MAEVVVIGGDPAGLSTALFTAKNDLSGVRPHRTSLHKAHLFNYFGVRSISGVEFLAIARGQTRDRGADLCEQEVTDVESLDDGFTVTTEDEECDACYVMFATGANRDLAPDLGYETGEDDTVDVNLAWRQASRTPTPRARWSAPRSGRRSSRRATAALSILSKEKGEHFPDFETPADVPWLDREV